MISINLTGRLTRDPELRHVESSSSGDSLEVCQVRVASRNRRGDTVYLDLSEWGAAGRAAARRLRKGSQIAFSGELRFKESTGENGSRQYLSAVGHIEFLGGQRGGEARADSVATVADDVHVADDDIPF